MNMTFVITQSFGIISTIFFLLSYQTRSNRNLYLMQAAGCGTFALQYLLLGAYSGCLSQVFVIVRNLMLSKYNQWAWVRSRAWVPVFILIAMIITRITWNGPLSLIPLLVKDYATVTVVDTRYIASDLLGQYLQFDEQDVLFLYSTLILNSSNSLK